MDSPRTGRRLQTFILPTDGPIASDQSLPYQLDHTAFYYICSGDWKDFRGITDMAIIG